MCAINGFIGKNPELLEQMNQVTKHRGPDGSGVFIDEYISLGHNLLSITDIAPSSIQPFVSPDQRFVLGYNGEVYNYLELRRQLEKAGDHFVTNSDTEVIFKGLIRYGKEFLQELDGMFAIAFYDAQEKKLVLARDPSGIKLLYLYQDHTQFIFSSELRGIFVHPVPRQLDIEATNIFFFLGYVPGPKTLVKNISKLCPGQYWTIDVRSQTVAEKGWLPRYTKGEQAVSFDPGDFREMIGSAVKRSTQGIRPFGLYLSGGLDSTMILWELIHRVETQVKTYTTRFAVADERFNEDADVAARLAREYGVDHHELLIREEEYLSTMEQVIETIEEPRWNQNLSTYWLLAQYASRDIVVCLNGSGGDELFFGYHRYLDSRRMGSYFERFPQLALNLIYSLRALKKGELKPTHLTAFHHVLDRWVYLNRVRPQLRKDIFHFPLSFDFMDVVTYLHSIPAPAIQTPLSDAENAYAEYDRLFWLADEEFIRTDKITMHFSMEGRFPLLARDIVHFANRLPSREKIKGNELKALVREAYRGYLPDYVLQKKKTGWTTPLSRWITSRFGQDIRLMLTTQYYAETANLFSFATIQKEYIDNTREWNTPALKRFMTIASFQMWARQFGITL